MIGNDEFYIGWEGKAPPGVGWRVRRIAVLLLVLGVALGVTLALSQRTIGTSVFEWGKVKEFTGILKSRPYPHLLVPRPGQSDGQTQCSSYHLVNPFKFGLDAGTVSRLDGRMVGLKGTLIYRGNQTMIEVVNGSMKPTNDSTFPRFNASTLQRFSDSTLPMSLGQQTLVGEIVDSKCYLGVMNPGALTPHRACAIRCISGGIPPVLLVRQPGGTALYFLLVARDGRPVNKEVLNLVAEPVEIRGEVERQGDMLILRADPVTYRRVPK